MRVLKFVRRNALNITVLLTTFSVCLCIYAVLLVEHERSAAILRECQNQDQRYEATVTRLNKLQKQQHKQGATPLIQIFNAAGVKVAHPERLAKAVQKLDTANHSGTLSLIDGLAPHRNCHKLASRATS